jgi:hypothetical protein
MTLRGYFKITIAVAGALAGIVLGDAYLRLIWPLLNTETYKSILPYNSPELRFISELIELLILFSAGAICGMTSGFTGGRRFQIPIAIAGYIYAFIKLLPYGFIEGTPAAFPIPIFGSGICSLGILAGFWFTTVIAGTSVRVVQYPKAG